MVYSFHEQISRDKDSQHELFGIGRFLPESFKSGPIQILSIPLLGINNDQSLGSICQEMDISSSPVSSESLRGMLARRFLGMTNMPLLPIRKLPEVSLIG